MEDYLPLIGRHFPVATDRSRLVFGGASFGGIAALHMARKAPDVFGGILCESPSLWVNEGRYLQARERSPAAQRERACKRWLAFLPKRDSACCIPSEPFSALLSLVTSAAPLFAFSLP